jgi:UDPglucose 6-dehydrogenase
LRLAVYGLWHLGCVTAACAASAGHSVVGLDPDAARVAELGQGRPPLAEPGLPELLRAGLAGGTLGFTTEPSRALAGADLLWLTFDTPIDERNEPDAAFLRRRLDDVANAIAPGTLVVVSSQVPVGFTGALARDWQARGLRYACSPENLRLGRAIEAFRRPDRIVVGIRDPGDRPMLADLLRPFSERIEWMSIESAEMTKHAVNAFLATSVAFANEVARLCEVSGADAKEVERGLRSERRIGPHAYLSPGAPFAGGTLARDLRALEALAEQQGRPAPLLAAVGRSNEAHGEWLRAKITASLVDAHDAVVAVLGLAYTPGTSTLRGSAALATCAWLAGRGVRVQAHDPAVTALPPGLGGVRLCDSARAALEGADLALLATGWPEYRALGVGDVLAWMRRPQVLDPGWFLADTLGADPRVVYLAAGQRRDPEATSDGR